MGNEHATRQVYWNIDGKALVYVLLAIVVACFIFFFVRLVRLWRLGVSDNRKGDVGKRLWGVVRDSILQLRVVAEKSGGTMHILMYIGFIVLFAATVITFCDVYFGTHFLVGDFYLYFISLGGDLAGLALCVGMVFAIVRRARRRGGGSGLGEAGHTTSVDGTVAIPEAIAMDGQPSRRTNLPTKPGDIVILVCLLLIGITGFFVEGLRIVGTDDPWRMWSPVGNLFALAMQGLSPDQISIGHKVAWWVHLILAFTMLATWSYTKLVHVFLIPLDVYRRNLGNAAELPFVDIEDEGLETLGVNTVTEFTRKDLLDTEACIRCGRCADNCPAWQSGKGLSPMGFVQGLRSQLETEGSCMLKDGRAELSPVVGTALSAEDLWDCTTCGACLQNCPSLVEVPSKIVRLRTYQMSMEGSFPKEAQSSFRGLETHGNPWGLGWQKRSDWMRDLDIPLLADNPDAEYLYWPGCAGAYDARNAKVSKALVGLLKEAGVSFAVLGNEEKCCGDAARLMGNEYLYYMLASENIATLDSYGVKKIIVQCPHCLTALTVDYPQLGGHYEVIHHSELLARLVDEGRLELAGGFQGRVAFHDSCYLGRYRGIYDAPRAVATAAGATVAETARSKGKSFCCGAGGGRMWLEENEGARINRMRAKQLLAESPEAIATSCPFCLSMIGDGTAAEFSEVPVLDIAEIAIGAFESGVCDSLVE